ncbi:family 43 glycosylhydrolase [Sedimentisphaera salicampi]|uniref:Arabinoxylan arabinofuranohydrolase n=1 Tax=Sedimentisphaera salicampi TaxID=1941349 RepID=A0A1W6LJX5_9BACT|nr:family 43 glycosylhydrolase [Sedimentisphaera salicampi]ARN56034.1 Arabinoxylan arabinofuranohydrolase precursor [Sedimentisphaera salicampi]
MKKLRKTRLLFLFPVFALTLIFGNWHTLRAACEKEFSGYLFTYFTGNGPGEEQIHFALSLDGFNYKALNSSKPVISSSKISSTGGVRDPHILRGADGKTFYIVATDLYVPDMGWNNYAMIMLKSKDLIHWESSVVNIPETFPEKFGDVNRVWAPQTIYDENAGKYMVYFSMKQGDEPDVIYYAYADKDFAGLESAPKQLYYPPEDSNTKACIDGDIIKKDGRFYLFYKAEDGDPGIKLAVSNRLTEGYRLYSSRRMDRSRHRVEGSGIFKLNDTDEWILMYDVYTRGRYQFTRSSDLLNFKVIDDEISMDFHPRHGTVMPITSDEYLRLVEQWGSLKHLSFIAGSKYVKTNNVSFDVENKVIHLPVKNETDLESLDPEFSVCSFASVSPEGAQDFSEGAVEYTFEYVGTKEKYQVRASRWNNPVLSGLYADPDIIYSEKTGKFYIYPTSDGYTGWSGTFFKAFSSENLVNWKDEGVILDLKKDVSWTSRNAWAPCIIEKKIEGNYKYFYYFTAAQKIGVAVSDEPAGRFVDSGKPLISSHPEGINRGQEIDPDVFCDPQTGKDYLFWGNGYLAGAELSDDMLSIKQDTLKIMTPDRTFREGVHVFCRKGKYYFLWSENDTRSEDYRVRYAVAESPLGELNIPEDNLILSKAPEKGIYATGHNSTIAAPNIDQRFIVYHRFTYPKGIEMGRSAGYNREVCIDKMQFDESGRILPVEPTHEGISPLSVQK